MLLVEAVLMVLPMVVGLVYGESLRTVGSFLLVIAAAAAVGFTAGIRKPKSMRFYAKEGLVIASLSWFVLSVIGGLPFVISGEIHSVVDAFFETASGFTTTGSTILTNVEGLSHSMLFWRSFTHLIGGMGVIVFALAVLPSVTSESVHMMKAEVPGPTFGKLVSKIRDTARILYIIYLSMTAVLIVLLMLGGMDWFDASVHAFGAAGTGGFSSKNVSVLYFDSAYIDYVLGVAMILFGANFNLYYLILIGQAKKVLKSEELRWYLIIIFGAVALICFNLFNQYESLPRLIRDAFFTVSSIITTTGYCTVDFGLWPVLSHVVLLLIMFIGACAGSTGGGLKVSRVGVLVKSALSEIRKSKEPTQVVRVRFEGNSLNDNDTRAIGRYFTVYVGIFFMILLVVSLDSPDFLTAFSAVTATFNNIGPGLSKVGPITNFSAYSDLSKLVLSVGMIAGRLELYPVLVLFLPSTWRRRG
jgi:trk system potassium uptake protein TrkH